ncbi:MAG: amino acid ABC transporter permease [Actinomycetota bacterium]|nr:amino acid ABC transporter permease [Actinomycetota bacterium]
MTDTAATRVDTLEPIPVLEPAGPSQRRLPPRDWARANLFSSRVNTVLTLVFGLLLAWLVYRVVRFAFFDARWLIIERNITNLMVFHFPRGELWRVWAALYVLAGAVGLGVGAAGRRRMLEVEEGRAAEAPRSLTVRRIGPLVLLVAVLLVFARSLTATALVAGVATVAIGFRFVGQRLPPRHVRLVALAVLAAIAGSYLVITAFGGVPRDRWGGLLLTAFLAVGGILLSFPLGVLLALGRRSTLPAVRLVCTIYIELIRGVPLITVLFMSAFALGFFLPPGSDRPTAVTRALVALVLFTAAYVAEIVRGGLQGVPRGQIEAAQALGLSPLKTTRLIVLPQALRSVIPGLVGQFISLFKDTSLVFIVGLSELLAVAQNITKQPDFVAQGLFVETLIFAAFVYWAGSYWMSRESQRLETRLGVGVR